MELHTDYAVRVTVRARELPWAFSPDAGVERRMLDRDGGEVARATTLVRYAPGAQFQQHVHARGEEFLVLEGEFVDEHGAYPKGTYVRNPWETRHSPSAPRGCVIFVKLRQMVANDTRRVVINTLDGAWRAVSVGRWRQTLHLFGSEDVRLERWLPGTNLGVVSWPGGAEIFVLSGSWEDECGRFDDYTWVRLPRDNVHRPVTAGGCTLLLKSGHLPEK